MNFRDRIVDLHIIDALDEKWAAQGKSEALALRFRLRKTRVKIVSHYCWDIDSLKQVIHSIQTYRTVYRDPRKAIPYLHIACHGVQEGLTLGDDGHLPWKEFSEVLLPLQKHIDYTLPMTLSACHGYYGYQLACEDLKSYGKKRPFYLLTGPQARIKAKELISAYATFYKELLHRYSSIKQAIERANTHISNPEAKLNYSFGVEVFRNASNNQ